MAESYLRTLTIGKAEVYNAEIGTHGVNLKTVATMEEDGNARNTSNHSEAYPGINFDYVINICANKNCPFLATKEKKFHDNFFDRFKSEGLEDKYQRIQASAKNE